MRRKLINDKKGIGFIIFFFLVLFTILVGGFMVALIVGVVDYAGDTITPVMEGVGMVGSSNFSQTAEYTFGTTNTVIQEMKWLVGLAYVLSLIFSVGMVVISKENPHPMFIGVYVMLSILLIFGAIIMSNMYQDIYTGTDDLSVRLQEQTLMSYMILYSPIVLTVISLITGIWLFVGKTDGGGVTDI